MNGYFPLRLRLYYKAARVGGVMCIDTRYVTGYD